MIKHNDITFLGILLFLLLRKNDSSQKAKYSCLQFLIRKTNLVVGCNFVSIVKFKNKHLLEDVRLTVYHITYVSCASESDLQKMQKLSRIFINGAKLTRPPVSKLLL